MKLYNNGPEVFYERRQSVPAEKIRQNVSCLFLVDQLVVLPHFRLHHNKQVKGRSKQGFLRFHYVSMP